MISIKDRVAIIGMGCIRFGERWDQSPDDMLVDVVYEAIEDAGIDREAIQAAWIGSSRMAMGQVLGRPLKLRIPITRVENACAGGTESFRGACYAVAAGIYDIAIAAGVEKLKDSGYSGLDIRGGQPSSEVEPALPPPTGFAMRAISYCHKYGYSVEQLKEASAKLMVESHKNGSLNPRAHFRRTITEEQVINAPMIAYPLGVLDCCGISDGAAAAIIVPIDKAKEYRDDYVVVKSATVNFGSGGWTKKDDFIHFDNNKCAAETAYREAGIKDPRKEIDMAIVHDCFSINQLIIMEDLGFSQEGAAIEDVNAGFFKLRGGGIPINTDGGLKCFGHPIAASGLRMIYEVYKQIQGKTEKPERQLSNVKLGLTHNMGGHLPGLCITGMTILGRRED